MTHDAIPPIDQLAEATRQTAARVEAIAAELVALRGRMPGLDARIDAANTAVQQSVEHWESLRAEMGRMARFEAALAQLRTEIAHEQAVQQGAHADEIQAVRARLAEEARRLGLELGVLLPRIEAVEAIGPRVDAAERERVATTRAVQAVDARLDAVAAERTAFQEDLRLVEQRAQARMETVQAQLREQEAELGQWRGRIESQSEMVREARAVADHMHEQATRLAQDHHATAEAERMFEQRVESQLTNLRREVADEWQRFLRERAVDWSALRQANAARDAQDLALVAQVEASLARLVDLEHIVTDGLALRGEEIRSLRRDLAGALGAWRQTVAEATEIVEAAVGQAETTAALEERRLAMRRALRAQRAARED